MILVVGATGNVGRELVGQLCDSGQPRKREGTMVAWLT